jgi:EAL domain-containing protein (putative c-di-GMP-specific phosphodiesterase class I)
LVRWNHPSRGVLPPSEFITLAEEIGLISEIDSRSRLNACEQLAKWRQDGLVNDNFNMKFNVCAQLLTEEDLYENIIKDLHSTGLPGHCVGMEITESILIENLQQTAKSLQQLIDFGIDISVDDFGTGYSSIAYLKELPARTLKIDQKFVQGVPENASDCRILRAMIVFAKSLELKVIVEGVETREQARICRDYGADLLQGYLFSKPLSPDNFEELLRTHNAQEWSKLLSTLGTLSINR